MPAWIHDRADHIRQKNPEMPKSQAFAIATQQSYAAGKAPKDYGTKEGRRGAHQKYDSPKSSYMKTPNPKTKSSSIDVASVMGFSDELQKIAAAANFTTTKDVQKSRSLTSMPKLTSKPQESGPPSLPNDPLSSTRSTPPPPITTG
jgi:hypothetical protein